MECNEIREHVGYAPYSRIALRFIRAARYNTQTKEERTGQVLSFALLNDLVTPFADSFTYKAVTNNIAIYFGHK